MTNEELIEATAELGVALRCILEPLSAAAFALENETWARAQELPEATEARLNLLRAWDGLSIAAHELSEVAKTTGTQQRLALYPESFPRREREHEVTPEQALRLVYEIIEKVKR